MATFKGSGKWIKIDKGVLSFGIDEHTCSQAYAATVELNGKTYYGFIDPTIQHIEFPQLSRVTLYPGVGYTGTVKMYTKFECPYQVFIEEDNYYDVETEYAKCKFVNGFLVEVN